MNYLAKPFVLENIVTGDKEIVRTWRQYLTLTGDQAASARKFMNGFSNGIGEWIARAQASFELIA